MCPGSFITEPSFSCFFENSKYNSVFVFANRHLNSAFYSLQQTARIHNTYSPYIHLKNRYLIAATNQPSYKPYNHQIL